MRFLALFVSLFALASVNVGVQAITLNLDLNSLLGIDWSARSHYNAPLPPWDPRSSPGWYFGKHPEKHPKLFCLVGLVCKILDLFPPPVPKCPKFPKPPVTTTKLPPSSTASSDYPTPTVLPPDGYEQTFANLTGATQHDSYLTFGLVDTIPDCKAMCDGIAGCKFANTYNDVNGKDGSTKLTCSLFTVCQTASTATNTGGQTQPDGSVNYIRNSDGWCKGGLGA